MFKHLIPFSILLSFSTLIFGFNMINQENNNLEVKEYQLEINKKVDLNEVSSKNTFKNQILKLFKNKRQDLEQKRLELTQEEYLKLCKELIDEENFLIKDFEDSVKKDQKLQEQKILKMNHSELQKKINLLSSEKLQLKEEYNSK